MTAAKDDKDVEETPQNPNPDVQEMNEAMARQNEADAQAAEPDPLGSLEATAENVRRHPEAFTDEQVAAFDEELEETDAEKQLAEDAAEADKAAKAKKTDDKSKSSSTTSSSDK